MSTGSHMGQEASTFRKLAINHNEMRREAEARLKRALDACEAQGWDIDAAIAALEEERHEPS